MGDDHTLSEAVKAELKEKYLIAKKILDEESPNDTESEPFKSKYKALEVLKNMQNLLLNSVDNANPEDNEATTMLAIVYLNVGLVSVDTEDLKYGEEYLMNCIRLLNQNETKANIILCAISALNQLGIVWSKRDQTAKAQEYLERAEKLYKAFISLDPKVVPISMSSIFGIDDSEEPPATEVLEKLHTLTLYYLAQIYGNLENLVKSSAYCHLTIKRQLEMNDYESIDWALNAATLSQFFMEKNGFTQARHHLAAATYILGKYEDTLKQMSSKPPKDDAEKELMDSKWENFKHRSADISRCWAKYGIFLMTSSKDRLIEAIENGENPTVDSTNINVDPEPDLDQEFLDQMKFQTIEKDIEHIVNTITDKYLLDFNDAKEVFLNVQKWLDDAKSYYTLENQASDYVQIIQDMSQLYKYLAFFEENEDRQAKMHKRRIDLLEGVAKELNERYYLAACQQIWVELGQTYSDILDIKLDRLKAVEDRPTPHMLMKVNNLTKSAIESFQKFLNSIVDSKDDKFSEVMIRPALCAYFHLGRLYNKFITPDKKLQLENTRKSYDAYTFLVNYCEKDTKAAEIMSTELAICKDFITLLPVKLNKLTIECANL